MENDEKEEYPGLGGVQECAQDAVGVMISEEEEAWVGPYRKARQDLGEFYRREVRSFSECEACGV